MARVGSGVSLSGPCHTAAPLRNSIDSSVSSTYGEREETVYNGHTGCSCYDPMFVFNQFGDVEHCALRPGNVHSAYGSRTDTCIRR